MKISEVNILRRGGEAVIEAFREVWQEVVREMG